MFFKLPLRKSKKSYVSKPTRRPFFCMRRNASKPEPLPISRNEDGLGMCVIGKIRSAAKASKPSIELTVTLRSSSPGVVVMVRKLLRAG